MSTTTHQVYEAGWHLTYPWVYENAWYPIRGIWTYESGWKAVYGVPYSLTAGTGSSGTGFDYLNTYGSINGSGTPLVLPTTYDLQRVFTGAGKLTISITGPTSDPGSTALVAAVVGTNLFLGTSATYAYNLASSKASWAWTTAFTFSSGTAYNCSVIGPIATG